MKNEVPAKLRFDTLMDFSALENLIQEGESEDLFYECKAPTQPTVNQDVRVKLAKAVSGFSNTEGGVLFYGIETQKHKTTGEDVMIQVTPVGAIAGFAKRVANLIPTLTMPAVTKFEYRVIKKRPKDTAGVLIIYFPASSRPIQSLSDSKFWFRGGDQFVEAPYTVVERLFAATDVPDIGVEAGNHKIIDQTAGHHSISLVFHNESAAAGRDIKIAVEVKNADDTSSLSSPDMHDASSINNSRHVYTHNISGVLHKGLNTVAGELRVVMKPRKRKLVIIVDVFADKMAARRYHFTCHFTKKTCRVQSPIRIF